jgi:hypothetical protein
MEIRRIKHAVERVDAQAHWQRKRKHKTLLNVCNWTTCVRRRHMVHSRDRLLLCPSMPRHLLGRSLTAYGITRAPHRAQDNEKRCLMRQVVLLLWVAPSVSTVSD